MRRVVITGIGLLTSIGNYVEDTWNNLISCKSGIKKITHFDTDNLSCKIAGFISENPNDRIYGLYYWIFPNIMLNFYSWGLSINIIEPISTTHTRIRFLSYPIKNKQQPSKGAAALSQVETEDQKVVLNVQKGIKSRYYNAGRYSPQYEKGVHHFHLLLDSYLS